MIGPKFGMTSLYPAFLREKNLKLEKPLYISGRRSSNNFVARLEVADCNNENSIELNWVNLWFLDDCK